MCVDRPAVRASEDAAVVRVEVQSLVRVDQGFLAAITLERKRNDGTFIFVSPLWFLRQGDAFLIGLDRPHEDRMSSENSYSSTFEIKLYIN